MASLEEINTPNCKYLAFKTDCDSQLDCPSCTIVWVDCECASSPRYHFALWASYGNVCQILVHIWGPPKSTSSKVCMHVCINQSINQLINHSLPTPTIHTCTALQIPLLSTAWISLPRFNGFTVSSVGTHKWVPGEQTHQHFHSLHAFQETHSALWQAFEVQSDLACLLAASELTLMPLSLDSHLPSLESSGWIIRRIWSLLEKNPVHIIQERHGWIGPTRSTMQIKAPEHRQWVFFIKT